MEFSGRDQAGSKSENEAELSGPSEPADAELAAAQIECHFLAELSKEIVIAKTLTLSVTISRELVEAASDKESKHASSAKVKEGVMLIVEAWVRRNLRIVGETRVELNVPAPNASEVVYFDVIAPQIMVVVRQGALPLARLDLQVTAVEQRPKAVDTARVAAIGMTADNPPAPMNQLRIFDSEDDGKLRFWYDLSLPGITFQRFQSDEIKGDRTSYVENLYREIEKRYARSKDQDEEFRILLKSMGGQLFSELLPLPLQKLLWKYKDRLNALQVISTEPFVPWELIFLKDPDEKGLPKDGKFLAELGLTRWISRKLASSVRSYS